MIRCKRFPVAVFPVLLFFFWCLTLGVGKPQTAKKKSYSRIGAPSFQYNYQTRETLFQGTRQNQAWIFNKEYKITANRIFWNRKTEVGRCFDHVRILDKKNDIVITGGAAWHYSSQGRSLVRRNPLLYIRKNDIRVRAEEMVRLGSRKMARALRNVVITSKEGTARGELAVYDLKNKTITLTGDPVLEQKTNTHRAEKIVFYQDDNKVVFEGRAVMHQPDSRIHADRIVILDRAPQQKKGDPRTKKKPRDRVAHFYGNVRIYRYKKNGALDSIMAGGYGEFFEKRDYARMLASPRMVMAGDNTIIHGAVMEQFRKRNFAVVKGNVRIVKQYRTVEGQLAQYLIDKKKIILTGSPVITEYGDSYRADRVVFDTAKDTVSWTGESRAVIGIEDQSKKAKDWAARFGIKISRAATLARIRKVIGEVYISSSDTSVTNNGIVQWGKMAVTGDPISSGLYLILRQKYGWCDFSSGGSRGRLSSFSALRFLPVPGEKSKTKKNKKSGTKGTPGREKGLSGKKNRVAASLAAKKARGRSAALRGGKLRKKSRLSGRAIGRKAKGPRPPGPLKRASGGVRKKRGALLLLKEGRLFLDPASGGQAFSLPYLTITNLTVPVYAASDIFNGELVLFTPAMRRPPRRPGERTPVVGGAGRRRAQSTLMKPVIMTLDFPALAGFVFSGSNARALFLSNIRPLLRVEGKMGMKISLDYELAEKVEKSLATLLSNRMVAVRTNTNAAHGSIPVVSGGRPPDGKKKKPSGKGTAVKKQPVLLEYTPSLLKEVRSILSLARGVVGVTPLSGRGSRLQEELEEMRSFLYPVSSSGKGAKDGIAPPGNAGSKRKQSGTKAAGASGGRVRGLGRERRRKRMIRERHKLKTKG